MVSGTTGSVKCVMKFVTGPDCHALIQRNSHRSVVHGLREADARISTVCPKFNSDYNVFMPVDVGQIQHALDEKQDINLVIITSPTYEGFTADVTAIGKLCKAKGITLVVDGAHGSLFPFIPELFPVSGIGIDGVDIVIQSLHKAAGSLSQCSIVHLNKTSTKSAFALELALFQGTTTSPSSLMLLSMEETVISSFINESARKRIRNTVE